MSGLSIRRNAPTAIELSDEIAHQIGIESVQALAFGPRGGIEIGGILLASSWGVSTNIDDFRSIPCEHFFGPSYRLSDHDMEVWRETVGLHAPGPMRIIGYWRSAIADTTAPDTQDRQLLDELVPEVSIFISVRPMIDGACRGALYLFERGAGDWVAHPLFDLPTQPGAARQAEDEPKRTPLRVFPAQGPKRMPALPPGKVLNRLRRKWKRYVGAAVAAVAASILILAGFAMWHAIAPRFGEPALDASKLGLEVAVQQAGTLRITWDHLALGGANHGVLLIRDGQRERSIALDQAQLETGFVVYTPASDDVSLRLTVGDRNIFSTARVIDNSPKAARTPTGSATVRVIVPRKSASIGGPRPWPAATDDAGVPVATAPAVPRSQEVAPPAAVGSELGPPQPAVDLAEAPSIVPPRPLTKVMPPVRLAGLPIVNGPEQINVRLAIDESGRVTSVSEIKQARPANRFLLAQALTAAKSWTFAAARRDGHPVPSDYVVTFSFGPSK